MPVTIYHKIIKKNTVIIRNKKNKPKNTQIKVTGDIKHYKQIYKETKTND